MDVKTKIAFDNMQEMRASINEYIDDFYNDIMAGIDLTMAVKTVLVSIKDTVDNYLSIYE